MRSNLVAPAAVLFAMALAMSGQEATVREEQQVFKTYPYAGPDPAPIMSRSAGGARGAALYPYFSFDNLSYTGVNKPWTVVRLENPYIEAFILPAEGGKLIGAVEKGTGKDFIYFNHVRKYRHIALRGPWTSGGIELNFGIVGHTPATASPVDYVTRKNPDGSVTCIVGTMDLPSRTQWRVAFTIPPDKAYIEARSLLYNPHPLNQSYYVWMNAANKLSKDVEFIFPGNSYIGHDYSVPERPWPMTADGRNLALYKEHNDSDEGSFFITGALEDFSGSYWRDSDFGYGHWAVHEEVPGQKFFRWPLSRAGAIWESLLTDADGPYFEPQTGRLLDQNDHEFLAPLSTDQWRELYFPYKKIGPMVKATPYAVLNVRNSGEGLVVSLCALQKTDETLLVRAGEKEIFRDRVVLKPMEVYQKKIAAVMKKGELRVDLGNRLSYTDAPDANVLKRPLNFRVFDESSLEGLYQSAERHEKGRDYDAALNKYLEVLSKEPLHMRALARVAELYYRKAEYEQALAYARKALDYVMYDPDANFIYGIIARRMGDLTDAKETLGWAARSMKYRAGAYAELGAIYIQEGNLERAVAYLEESLQYDANNVGTQQLLSTAYRLRKEPGKARQSLGRILETDPLNHLARFEEYLLAPGAETLDRFKSMIRNELPHETYLETAVYYANLGLNNDALRVLEAGPDQATIRYWQAYLLREKSPAESRRVLARAAALSPYLVFPFRQESIPVFQWAAAAMPGDWKAKYYLALIHWGLGRNQEAVRMLQALGNRPDYAPAYVSRAFLEQRTHPASAQADYERAHALGADDWRNSYHLATFYSERGMHEKALKLALDASRRFPNQDLIKILLARSYRNSGRYRDCYSVLENATILPFEGQRDVHDLFVQCQISMALGEMKGGRYSKALGLLANSREYPERLGTGKPYDPDYRVQDYLTALCYEGSGSPAKAVEALKEIRAYAARHRRENVDTVKKQVDQWYRTTLKTKTEGSALEQLFRLVRGK